MRSEFLEHYTPSDAEFADLWTNGIFIFDTNALLRLFRYRETTVQQIFEVLLKADDRVWCPYQVAWEYQRNRLVKIQEAEASFQGAMKDFENAHDASSERLRGLQDFGIHPKLQLDTKISDLSRYVQQKIGEIRSEYDANPLNEYFNGIHDRLGRYLEGKVGAEPTADLLAQRIASAEERTSVNVPPGFVDAAEKKKDKTALPQSVYGDVLLWFEIIDYAKEQKKSVIFVTEDNKKDCWKKDKGRTIGPLPELGREFRKHAGGDVYFYNVSRFLENAKRYLNVDVTAESVADAEQAFQLSARPIVYLTPETFVSDSPSLSEYRNVSESPTSIFIG
jgi:hypothetical protein